MPKQPGGISKTLRVQTLLDVLNKHGILDKSTITEKVSLRLAIDKELIDRALYRDLDELVSQNKIHVIHKDSFGNTVDVVNNEIQNFKSFWHTDSHHPDQILGVGLLKSLDGNCLCTKNLLQDIRISEILQMSDIKDHSLIFSINHRYFNININPDCYPLKVILTRKTPEQSLFNQLISQFSKRLIIIVLPDLTFPSIKSSDAKEITYFDLQPNELTLKNPAQIQFKVFKEQNIDDFNQFFFKKDKTVYAQDTLSLKTKSQQIAAKSIQLHVCDLVQTEKTILYFKA